MKPGLATLQTVPMLKNLDVDVLDQLNRITEVTNVRTGTVLCHQGELADQLHVLIGGRVTLSGTMSDGTSALVDVVHSGGHFVLAAVLTELPYLMTAHAVLPSSLLLIDAVELRRLLKEVPRLAFAIMRAEAMDFRQMVRHVRDLKLRSIVQRLGCYLLALVPDYAGSSAEVLLPLDKGLLAARLGCRQENLSRAFATLRAVGVETRGARVTLNDIPQLMVLAMPDDLNDPRLID